MTQPLPEIVRLFLKLGLIAFGGPAAHIAIMRDEVVRRRKWLAEQHFVDLIGATSLIPGPNSTEMAIHVGFIRGGWWGLALAGVSFIVPAMLIVLALSWAYVTYGQTPQVGSLLYGVKPVIIAIILQALVMLGRVALKGPLPILMAPLVLVLYFLGGHEIVLLLGAVAIGQVTPGPVLTTATFVGYVLGGLPGALVATLGIFLPSFVFVALLWNGQSVLDAKASPDAD